MEKIDELNDSDLMQDSHNSSLIIRENQQPKACLHILSQFTIMCCSKKNQIHPETKNKIKDNYNLRIKSL